MKLQLEIITPLKSVLKEEVDEIIIPTDSGEITILPNHVDLVSKVKAGEMTIKKSGKSTFYAITGGFLEISNNTVTILADYAVRAEDIEIAKAKEAQERAREKLRQKVSGREFAQAESDLRKSLAELHVAKRRRPSSPS